MKRLVKALGWTLLAIVLVATPILIYKLGHPDGPTPAETLAGGPVADGRLAVQFFGTTSLAFRDEKTVVIIDGYFTRPSMWSLLTGPVSSDPAIVSNVLANARIGRADLLLVSHSHIDHALDAALVARKTGALLVGSQSTRQIGLGSGIADNRIRVISPGDTLQAGDFSIRALRSIHSGNQAPGEITSPLRQPATLDDYKEGGTFAFLIEHKGLRILAPVGAIAPGALRGVKADVIFLSTGGLAAADGALVEKLWGEIVTATGARLVIPVHWDDFMRPLDKPMVPLPRIIADHAKDMAVLAPLAARDGVNIRFMPVVQPVDLAAAVKPPRR